MKGGFIAETVSFIASSGMKRSPQPSRVIVAMLTSASLTFRGGALGGLTPVVY
jgi:hypothetical protein